jgi:protease-4
VASDAIWRETIRARDAGKPVVVSMGSVAGSGGYFVAMGADRIVAQPSTITGSIGVFGGKMLIDGLSERLGVTWDDVRVGGNTTMWSLVEDYTPEERARLEASLDRIYADFTGKVAEGRGMTRDSVHALARGRIWTGADALRLGLVDELGGMDVALRLAKEEAGIDPDTEVTLREYPRAGTFLERMLQRETSSYPASMVAVARLVRFMEGVAAELRAAGVFGAGGALHMPQLPIAP